MNATERLIAYRVTRVEEQPNGQVLLLLGRDSAEDTGGIYRTGDRWYRAVPAREEMA